MQGEWEIVGFDEQPQVQQPSFADQYAQAVTRQESAFNPRAVSPAGAQGLMQIMPATGREVAQRLGMQNFDPFDAEQNQIVGKAYLNQMYEQFQDPQLALAAYNAGPGRVQQAIKRAGTSDPQAVLQFLPAETQNYVPKVQGNLESNYGAPNMPQGDWEIVPDEYEVVQDVQPTNRARPKYIPTADVVDEPAQPPQEQGWGDYISGLGSQFVNSAGFNLVDNYANQYQKLPESVRNVAESVPIFGNAAKYLGSEDATTESIDAFKKKNPKASLAAALGGAITQPTSMVSSLPRAVGSSMLSGFGDRIDKTGDEQDLSKGALIDSIIGSGAYGVGKVAGKGIEAYKGWKGTGNLSPAEKLLAKRLSSVPDDTLGNAKQVLNDTTQPMFLPEALQTEDLFSQAKVIANSPQTKDLAQSAINARTELQPSRVNEVLDEIAPFSSPAEASGKLKDASQRLADSLFENRSIASKATYGPVYQRVPVVSEELAQDILSSPNAQSVAKTLRRSREFMNKADNDTEFLHAVKSGLQSRAKSVTDAGEARLLNSDADYIRSALNNNVSGLADADLMYSKLSQNIDDVTSDSLIGMAINKSDLNIGELGNKILSSKTDTGEIKKLISNLGEDGESLVLSAVRAELSDRVANRVGGKGITSIFDKQALKDRLTDIMGEAKAGRIIKKIEDEVTIAEGTRKYKIGSDTAENLKGGEAEDYIRNAYGYYGEKGLTKLGMDILGNTVGRLTRPSNKTLQDEAKTIFSNQEAKDSLIKILAERNYKPSSTGEQAIINALLTRGAQKTIPTIEIKNSYRD